MLLSANDGCIVACVDEMFAGAISSMLDFD